MKIKLERLIEEYQKDMKEGYVKRSCKDISGFDVMRMNWENMGENGKCGYFGKRYEITWRSVD